MWIYDKEKNEIREEPTKLKPRCYDGQTGTFCGYCNDYREHLSTLRTLPVSGNHLWEDGKRVEEGKDFEIRHDSDWSTEAPDVAVPLSPVESCSQHKKEIAGITDMKILAEMIGDLHYETLAELLSELCEKIYHDSYKDKDAGREKIAEKLLRTSQLLDAAAIRITEVWKISKPFMNPVNSKQ